VVDVTVDVSIVTDDVSVQKSAGNKPKAAVAGTAVVRPESLKSAVETSLHYGTVASVG